MASPQQLQIENGTSLAFGRNSTNSNSQSQRQRSKHQRRRPRQLLASSSTVAVATTAAIMGLFSTPQIIPAVDARAETTTTATNDLISQFNAITQTNNPFVTATPATPETETRQATSFTTVLSQCNDLSSITTPMYASDTDGNGFLNKEEYVQFTNTISGGYLSDMGWDDGFTDMPLSLQESYLLLSCLCEFFPEEDWGGKGCCTAGFNSIPLFDDTGIRTEGSGPGEEMDEVQEEYLTYVCGTMEGSLEKVGGEVVPTTASPIVEGVPTKKPSVRPVTVRPTREPSGVPSKKPTMKPTNQPTKKPSMQPTQKPTVQPTSEPSKKPSRPPSPSPTKRPTVQPVTPGDPTQSPTTSVPTKRPVITESPTMVPTKKPVTASPTFTIAPNTPITTTKPTPSSSVSLSPTILLYTGSIPTALDFVASANGQVDASDVMEGSNNQVKVMLEESLLELANIVVEEEFGGPTGSSTVRNATEVIVDAVQDVACPKDSQIGCLNFNNTILLYLVDEPNSTIPQKVAIFEQAMLAKIESGWLVDNFDLDEALKPPPVPGAPTTKPTDGSSSRPTKRPTTSPTDTPSVSAVPTMAPTVSAAPTSHPTESPSDSPSVSAKPSISSEPTIAPSTSSKPTTSASPTILVYTGTVPASVDFVTSSDDGQVTAAEVMAGTNNQVKVTLEESLLVLANIVVEEEFGSNETTDETTVVVAEPMFRKRRRVMERRLVVENATEAIVDDVQDVACSGAPCLNFNNTILLYMVDEPNSTVSQKVGIFEQAMSAKIADGWLLDDNNFDLEEALKPPPSSPPPTPNRNPDAGEGTDNDKGLEPQPLSAGAIVGVVLAVVFCFSLTILFAERSGPRRKARNNHDDILEDLERQETSFKGDEEIAAANVGSGQDQEMDSWSMSAANTADKSFASSDPLMQGQQSSSVAQSPMKSANMTRLEGIDSDNEQDESVYSHEQEGEAELSGVGSTLAAMGAASTLVSSTTPVTPRESPAPDIDTSSFGMASASDDWASAAATSRAFPADDFSSDQSMGGTGTSGPVSPPKSAEYVAAGGGAATSPQGATVAGVAAGSMPAAEEGGGLTAGAAAAIGAAGAGLVAAGAYAATRSSKDDESRGSASSHGSVPSAVDDLDNAIESGNWGQVGALAAILASQGRGTPPPNASRNARMSSMASTSASVSDGSRSSGQSGGSGERLERSRTVEIDRLVESGDWQGVVLAAARFEADQTFDGESYSASASQSSSRWTGSATSATTPRSMATTDQGSASNISSQRGQEEIRLEVEALVRRVVPEEADNIEEMMTQFKGREEELVETLRRMQERAIASRARLAVQKSAKLEARAKATPRGPSSVASHRSEKSELEKAIEAGNWQALGAAAQKMSNSRTGDLSAEEKTQLRNVLSASPALSRHTGEDHNLDSLIEQGDWQGVIAAAKAASEDSHGASQEENEALAQASMWQSIANQSKPEARQGPAGAGDAAAWAIQRSLQALDSSRYSSKGVRTIDDVANEDSDADASQYESSSYDESAGKSREYSRGI